MTDAPSPELRAVLRDQSFEEMERVATLVASYARSAGEAAFRGDEMTMGVHIRQLRLCCLSLIKTYKEMVDGQGMAEAGAGSSHGGREHQRLADGDARD
jgi:hypothetical protein